MTGEPEVVYNYKSHFLAEVVYNQPLNPPWPMPPMPGSDGVAIFLMGGKHSARAMQLAGKMYKDAGGGYTGEKTKAQKSMSKWTKEDWGTKSGKPSTEGSKATGERYLPEKARAALSDKEYAATSRAKRVGTKAGKQFVKQPKKIAEKTAKHRK